jgi:hypothetical protein
MGKHFGFGPRVRGIIANHDYIKRTLFNVFLETGSFMGRNREMSDLTKIAHAHKLFQKLIRRRLICFPQNKEVCEFNPELSKRMIYALSQDSGPPGIALNRDHQFLPAPRYNLMNRLRHVFPAKRAEVEIVDASIKSRS